MTAKLEALTARFHDRARLVDPALLTRNAAAAVLSISVRTFDVHVAPHVPCVRIGRARRWRRADLDAYIAARTEPAAVEPPAPAVAPAAELAPPTPAMVPPPALRAPRPARLAGALGLARGGARVATRIEDRP